MSPQVDVRRLKHSLLSCLQRILPDATAAAAQAPSAHTPMRAAQAAAEAAAAAEKLAGSHGKGTALSASASFRELQHAHVAAAISGGDRDHGHGHAHAHAAMVAESLGAESVHLRFICLLHLANELGLSLSNGGDLTRLDIRPGGAGMRLGA